METWGWGKDDVAEKKKILIIDDEVEFCYFTKKFLEHEKELEVIVENMADCGVKVAMEKNPDLILLDIIMPGMDGFAVLSRLKNNEETRSIPVIMLTAKGDVGSIAQAQSCLASDYIIKPFTPQVLLDLIKKHVGLKREKEDT